MRSRQVLTTTALVAVALAGCGGGNGGTTVSDTSSTPGGSASTADDRAEGIEAVCAAWQRAADAQENDSAYEALQEAEDIIAALPVAIRQGVRGDANTTCGSLKRNAETSIGERRRAGNG